MSDGIERETPMTAAELIAELRAFPPSAPVFFSGEFTQAVVETRPARVLESENSMSGYEDNYGYSDDAEPNAVLLI